MSLINKMLQDLDKRHAADGGGKTLTQQLRPVHARKDWRRIMWEVSAGLAVGAGWTAWVLYQISPRPLVTDLVFQLQARRPQLAATPQAPPAPAAASVAPVLPAPLSSAAAMTAPETRTAAPAGVDMLKLATEIATPVKEKRVATKPKAERGPAAEPATRPRMAAKAERKADSTAGGMAQGASAPAAQGQISIDKHAATPAERAEDEFRKATVLLNHGRVAEAMDAYKATLLQDARHAAARQALVGLLLENRRIDEAQQYLQEGLSLDPDRFAYAILLARIQVERGDLQGAHDLLRKYAASAAGDAEYQAFDAALLQRLGRHKEAVAAYQAALKLAPRSGLWWMGLGISLQADQRSAEALDAFRRAKSVGGLSPDLLAFVDQRMKQLQ
ncbi:MAG: tetratricopeptide repeat protein [Burkholderiales bacterium]|jgi:MSHA biogenesis protein MshN